MDFQKRYNKLNENQQRAVDLIDGPVMVIAGPGTGKTELLSVRVANILQKTDTLPENILCLTFTESGANAMRERLTQIIGKDAYKVAVHTFHSFGTDIINQNGQYFYNGAHFKPADTVSSYEVIRNIFEKLEYNNPVISQMNGEYTHLNDALKTISELKKSGLSSDELLKILDDNDETIFEVEKLLSPVFVGRPNKSTAVEAEKCINTIRNLSKKSTQKNIISLSEIIADTLTNATNIAISTGKTPAITKWRNEWFEKDKLNNFVLKSKNRQIKLRAIIRIYDEYLQNMEKAELFDFDDMILQIIKAMEKFDDLRFNLQEQFQYIMVDEFQDTNMAQMRILQNLTNNEVQGDTPNILVVGDDDQAIYSFQGADVSNILDFTKRYPKTEFITLTENYRSSKNILESSREIITQGENRLENNIDNINKNLNANNSNNAEVLLFEVSSISDERHYIVNDIKSKIASGVKPSDIAVLTRHHSDIVNLLPYFNYFDIQINYEKQDNAIEQEIIILIEKISKLLICINEDKHDGVNSLIPEILANQVFKFEPLDIWKLSIEAYDNHSRWLDIMSKNQIFLPIYNWLINTASKINSSTLEKMLDIIVGNPNILDDTEIKYISPIYNYYFSKNIMNNNPDKYLTYLESLRAIRAKLREYHTDETPNLTTFINFISLSRKLHEVITITRQSTISENAVNVMTAHKAKGLEFDTVYIINAVDTAWGQHSRGHNRLINYPENLRLAPAGETNDERLRLFYVAITRAKNQLIITYSLKNDNNKETVRSAFIFDSKLEPKQIQIPVDSNRLIESAELAWYQPMTNNISVDMHDIVLPKLSKYQLSVTHLQSFLNVKNGGPETFLLNNILQFPQEKSPSACFGTAIHDSLQFAHTNFASTKMKLSIEKIYAIFESVLKQQHLSDQDYSKLIMRGKDALQKYLSEKYDSFSDQQIAELNFKNQHCIINDAHITGKLDLVDIDKTNSIIFVTDFKTGKQYYDWKGSDETAKIRLHHYKQQLMFYKLLIENSRDYGKYKVEKGIMQFVEPTPSDEILSIETNFTIEEIENFIQLINAVWEHITVLNLPDISNYDQTFKGILAFENDLIENKI